MSRIRIYDFSGVSVGEIHADCSRGWVIGDGGQTTVTLTPPIPTWLQIGRMAVVEHERLPAWAGMIDTPWQAAPNPAMTLYDAGYLLSLRSPDASVTLAGTVGAILDQALDAANSGQDMLLRRGDVDEGQTISWTFEQRPWWEQLIELATSQGLELITRPVREGNRLRILVDIKTRLGKDTGMLLHDGHKANLEITGATVDGEIVNRVIGVGKGSSGASRLQCGPQVDSLSIERYRMRSKVEQWQDAGSISQLETLAKTMLSGSANPQLILQANVLDVGEIFNYLAPGNSFIVHAANVWFPGGTQGWRGTARISAMTYDETRNAVGVQLVGNL